MARLFSAVDIEDDDLLRKLKDVRDSLNLDFRPVPRDKMHITFQFFQDLNEEEVQKVRKAVENVSIDSFTAEVKGIGVFPSEEYIRVVWAGVEEEKFTRLYRQVSSHTVRPDNSHEFKPHITLLRVKDVSKDEKRKLQRTVREFEDHEFGTLKVDSVKLFESRLKTDGPSYRTFHRKNL